MKEIHYDLCLECRGKRVETPVNPFMNLVTGNFTPAKLIAWSCLECGYTSLYVQEADKAKLRNIKRKGV